MTIQLNDVLWLLNIPLCRWHDLLEQSYRPGFGWSCDMNCHLMPNFQSCDWPKIWVWRSHPLTIPCMRVWLLRPWSWANMLTFAPSLRWNSIWTFSLLKFLMMMWSSSLMSVFDVISLLINSMHQMITCLTCSFTMTKYLLEIVGMSQRGFRKENGIFFCLFYVGERQREENQKKRKIAIKCPERNSVLGWMGEKKEFAKIRIHHLVGFVSVVLVMSLVLLSDYHKKCFPAILVFCVMLVKRLFLYLIYVFVLAFLVGLFASFHKMKLKWFVCVCVILSVF